MLTKLFNKKVKKFTVSDSAGNCTKTFVLYSTGKVTVNNNVIVKNNGASYYNSCLNNYLSKLHLYIVNYS